MVWWAFGTGGRAVWRIGRLVWIYVSYIRHLGVLYVIIVYVSVTFLVARCCEVL